MPNLVQQRRLHFIIKEIKKGKYPSTVELARNYQGVSDRTIKRDIEYLNVELGANIAYDSSQKGYYFEYEPIDISSFSVSEKDIFTLYVAEKILFQYKGTPLYQILKQTLNKLLEQIPDRKEHSLELFNERIIIRATNVPLDVKDHFEKLMKAILNEKVIKFVHHNPVRRLTKERIVHPYCLVCEDKDWMMVGKETESGQIKNFAVWRISSVEILNEYFDYPKNFDPSRFESTADPNFWSNGSVDGDVVIHVKPYYAEVIAEKKWFLEQSIKSHADGSMTLTFPCQGNKGIVKWILGWGQEVEVISPTGLRKTIAMYVQNMYSIYHRKNHE